MSSPMMSLVAQAALVGGPKATAQVLRSAVKEKVEPSEAEQTVRAWARGKREASSSHKGESDAAPTAAGGGRRRPDKLHAKVTESEPAKPAIAAETTKKKIW